MNFDGNLTSSLFVSKHIYVPEHCKEATLCCHRRPEWSCLCYRWIRRPITLEFSWVFRLHSRWRWSLVLCRHNECTPRPCGSYNSWRYLFRMMTWCLFSHICRVLVVSFGFWVKVGCVYEDFRHMSFEKSSSFHIIMKLNLPTKLVQWVWIMWVWWMYSRMVFFKQCS